MGIVFETTMASPGVTVLRAVLVTAITLALLVGLILLITFDGLTLLIRLDDTGRMLAKLPIGLVKGPEPPAFYAVVVAVIVFVTIAVETGIVGGAAVPTGAELEEPVPLPEPPEQGSLLVAVMLAQVMRVLSAACTTMLRLPMKAGVSHWRER